MKTYIKPEACIVMMENSQMICLSYQISGNDKTFKSTTTTDDKKSVEQDPYYFSKQYTPSFDDTTDPEW